MATKKSNSKKVIGALYVNGEDSLQEIVSWHCRKGLDINYFVTNIPDTWNLKAGPEILFISPFHLKKLYEEGKVNKVVIETNECMDCAMNDFLELTRLGIKEDDLLFVPINLYYQEEPEEKELITLKNLKYAQHLEFHLTHRCNLNCGGCNHFVPLIPKDEEIDFNTMIKDWKHLRKIVSHISDISVLGGEPLLSDKLVPYCQKLRELWPYASINVYTNGLLVDKVPAEDLAELGRLEIKLRVSAYIPCSGAYDRLFEYCKGKNLDFNYELKCGMYPPLHDSEEKKFPAKNTEMCKWLTVENGRLYPCPLITYIKHFNKFFDEHYPEESGLDLYKSGLTLYDINKYCSSVHPLCDYCNEYPERGRNAGWLTDPLTILPNDKIEKKYWVK